MSETKSADELVNQVKERYGAIAEGRAQGCGCGCAGGGEVAVALQIGYRKGALERLPEGANLGLGCGAPIDHLNLQPGEVVLDLGSGAGIDCLLAAERVGPGGRVIGVDMTSAMLERARKNAERAGVANVEFREGRLEGLPVEDASVDAVTSNCVINLVPDKAAVFAEIARVLRVGGRLVVSDIILDGPLPEAVAKDVLAYVGCISGAIERGDYLRLLAEAGLAKVEVLKDVDYLEALDDPNVLELLGRTGVAAETLKGRVRSMTYRAVKA